MNLRTTLLVFLQPEAEGVNNNVMINFMFYVGTNTNFIALHRNSTTIFGKINLSNSDEEEKPSSKCCQNCITDAILANPCKRACVTIATMAQRRRGKERVPPH